MNPSSPSDDILDVVISSVQTGLQTHGENVVFQHFRMAPESVIVHYSALELNRRLQAQWPGQFSVLLERNKCDLQVVPGGPGLGLFAFEFKIPWSGGLIWNETADDFGKKLFGNANAFEVTVFLEVVECRITSNRANKAGSAIEFNSELPAVVSARYPLVSALRIKESPSFALKSGEGELRCTVTLWRAGRK